MQTHTLRHRQQVVDCLSLLLTTRFAPPPPSIPPLKTTPGRRHLQQCGHHRVTHVRERGAQRRPSWLAAQHTAAARGQEQGEGVFALGRLSVACFTEASKENEDGGKFGLQALLALQQASMLFRVVMCLPTPAASPTPSLLNIDPPLADSPSTPTPPSPTPYDCRLFYSPPKPHTPFTPLNPRHPPPQHTHTHP